MVQVVIQDTTPRTQSIATAGQTVFDTNWTADAITDVQVYARADGDIANDVADLVSSSDYNVTFVGVQQYVRVTFLSGRALDDIITIVRATPAARENLYTNTNFVPDMLNQDFGITTMVDQQNKMYDSYVNIRYNVSSTLQQPNSLTGGDVVLPVLEANQVWIKNPLNTGFIPYNLPSGGGVAPDDGQYLVQTADVDLPDAIPLDTFANGFMVNTNGTGFQYCRSLAGTTNQIAVTNSDGQAGNPTISIADNPVLPGTAGMGIPAGTTAQRVIPTPPSIGLRYNTTLGLIEAYIGGNWVEIPSGSLGNYLPLAGGTMSGVIDMDGNAIENLPAPVNPADAVNKAYADALASGFIFLNPVRGASTGAYTVTYNNGASGVGATLTATSNGAFTADGLTGVVGQRFLIKDQAATLQNGIYVVTVVGDGSNPFVLTRATDFDTSSEISINELVSVAEGTTQAGDLYRVTVNQPVIGTDPISFSIFLDASNIVTLNGNQTITGTKTFTANNDYGTPSAIALTNGTNLPITAGTTGTLGVTRGGTGLTATPTNGQLPIGNGTGFTLATLTAGSGVSITNGAGSINISATGSSGKILQVLSTALTTSFSVAVTGSNFTAVTGLSQAITPASTSNKVLVRAVISCAPASAADGIYFQIWRGGASITSGTSVSNRTAVGTGSQLQNLYGLQTNVIEFLDSPATTSSTTYQIYVSQVNNAGTVTCYINRSVTDTDTAVFPRAISTITVMEVSA